MHLRLTLGVFRQDQQKFAPKAKVFHINLLLITLASEPHLQLKLHFAALVQVLLDANNPFSPSDKNQSAALWFQRRLEINPASIFKLKTCIPQREQYPELNSVLQLHS
jgi:hypothetical protein